MAKKSNVKSGMVKFFLTLGMGFFLGTVVSNEAVRDSLVTAARTINGKARVARLEGVFHRNNNPYHNNN